jgi:hypothetical protein
MIQVQQSFFSSNTVQKNYQRQAELTTQLPINNTQSKRNLGSQISIKAESINSNLITAELTTRNVNEATALIQSVQDAATLIENKFVDMKALAIQNSGCNCQAMRKAQESIRDISNSFSWNGTNFLAGGGENNQKTTLRNFTVSTDGDTKNDIQIGFKSFNPMSAVDTDGSLEPLVPNLPDLNKSAGTDTHAFGDAALYSKLNEDAYLHTHTNAMKEQAIIQISRAIDGIKSERERLSGFLKRLNNISETNSNKTSNKDRYEEKIIDANQAGRIATNLKNEILSSSTDVKLSQLSIGSAEVSRLLN